MTEGTTMTVEEACRLVDEVAGRVLASSLEPGAVRHGMVMAVLGGWRPEGEAEVLWWLAGNGLSGLRRLPPPG